MDTWIDGTFEYIEGYEEFCELTGSIRLDTDQEVTDICIGGMGSEDLPDALEFIFRAYNGDVYHDCLGM